MSTATAAKERPILMSAPMVNGLLAGRKTQTRRVIFKDDDHHMPWRVSGTHWQDGDLMLRCPYGEPGDRLWVRETWALVHFWTDPETGYVDDLTEWKDAIPKQLPVGGTIACRADGWWESHVDDRGFNWRPSIFMPRWASRITLEITEVRVERLQSISEVDAIAEGLECQQGDGTGSGPGCKWNGPGYWDGFSTNPPWGKTYHAPLQSGLCCCHANEGYSLTPAVCAYRHLWEKINGKGSWDTNPWVWALSFRRLESTS